MAALTQIFQPTAHAITTDYQFKESFSSTQGHGQWYYKQANGSNYADMEWIAAGNYWRGSCPYCLIGNGWVHPDINDAVIAWKAPREGNVTLRGVADHQSLMGDGVRAKIMKFSNNQLTQLWPSSGYQVIQPNFMAQPIVKTQVAVNDFIYFHIDRGAVDNKDSDTTYWSPRVSYNYEPKYTLDKAEHVMTPGDFANIGVGADDAADISMSIIPNGTNFDFYHSSKHGSKSQKFTGPLNAPATFLQYNKYPFTDTEIPNGTGCNTPEGWWLANMYRTDEGHLLAFTHIENVKASENIGWWSIGLAYSTNNGNTFTKLGKIIGQETKEFPAVCSDVHANIFGVPYAVKDGYFYLYYGEPRAAVARAPIAEVLAAAQNGTVSQWQKYYNGTWNEPGMNGHYSPIMPYNHVPHDFAVHGDAAYSSAIGKYVLSGYTHIGGKGVFITFSDDGVNYANPEWIVTSDSYAKGTLAPYITIVNEDGSDNGQIGQTFYVYYSYRPNGQPNTGRNLYRQKITLNPAAFNKITYDASTDFGIMQDNEGWSYNQANGSNTANMEWVPDGNFWRGSCAYCLIGKNWQHPDSNDSVRTWIAPRNGTIAISSASGDISVAGGPGADGISVKVVKNSSNIWPISDWQIIAQGSSVVFPPMLLSVTKGDKLQFVVTRNSNAAFDTTNWNPVIVYQ